MDFKGFDFSSFLIGFMVAFFLSLIITIIENVLKALKQRKKGENDNGKQ